MNLLLNKINVWLNWSMHGIEHFDCFPECSEYLLHGSLRWTDREFISLNCIVEEVCQKGDCFCEIFLVVRGIFCVQMA